MAMLRNLADQDPRASGCRNMGSVKSADIKLHCRGYARPLSTSVLISLPPARIATLPLTAFALYGHRLGALPPFKDGFLDPARRTPSPARVGGHHSASENASPSWQRVQ